MKRIFFIILVLTTLIFSNDDFASDEEQLNEYQEIYQTLQSTFEYLKQISNEAQSPEIKNRIISKYDKYQDYFNNFSISSKIDTLKMYEPVNKDDSNNIAILLNVIDFVHILDQKDLNQIYDKKMFNTLYRFLSTTSVKQTMDEIINLRTNKDTQAIQTPQVENNINEENNISSNNIEQLNSEIIMKRNELKNLSQQIIKSIEELNNLEDEINKRKSELKSLEE